MRKVATLGLTLLAAFTLTACSSSSSSKSSDSSSNAANSSSKKASKNEITMDKYNSIKLGSMTTGSGGSTEKLVKSMYGKPSSETETDIPGSNEKSKSYTWSNVGSSLAGATVTTEFINGKAIGKGYADFGKSTKISLGTYDTLQTGTSFKAVKQQLGVPLTESIVGVTGITSAQTLTYTSKDGKDSLMLMFTNNKLTSKTKTSI